MPSDAEKRALEYIQAQIREKQDEFMNVAFLGSKPNYKNEVNADISQEDLDRARAGLRRKTIKLVKGQDYQDLGVVRELKSS